MNDARGRTLTPGDWVIHIQTGFHDSNIHITEGRILLIRNGALKIKKLGKEKPSWVYNTDHVIRIPQGY